MDIRDFMTEEPVGTVRLYPYAKDLSYHSSGTLSMTIQIYDDTHTQEYTFGFNVAGNLKDFLDQIYIGG